MAIISRRGILAATALTVTVFASITSAYILGYSNGLSYSIDEIRTAREETGNLEQRVNEVKRDVEALESEKKPKEYYSDFGPERGKSNNFEFVFSQNFKSFGEMTLGDFNVLQTAFTRYNLNIARTSEVKRTDRPFCGQECLEDIAAEIMPYIERETSLFDAELPSVVWGEKIEGIEGDYSEELNMATIRNLSEARYDAIAHELFHSKGIKNETLAEILAHEALANMALEGNKTAELYLVSSIAGKFNLLSGIADIEGKSQDLLHQALHKSEMTEDAFDIFPFGSKSTYIKYEKEPLIAIIKALTGEQPFYNGFMLDGLYRFGNSMKGYIESAQIHQAELKESENAREKFMDAYRLFSQWKLDDAFEFFDKFSMEYEDLYNKALNDKSISAGDAINAQMRAAASYWMLGAIEFWRGNLESSRFYLTRANELDKNGMARITDINVGMFYEAERRIMDNIEENNPALEEIEKMKEFEIKTLELRNMAWDARIAFYSGNIGYAGFISKNLREIALGTAPNEQLYGSNRYYNFITAFANSMVVAGDIEAVLGNFEEAGRNYTIAYSSDMNANYKYFHRFREKTNSPIPELRWKDLRTSILNRYMPQFEDSLIFDDIHKMEIPDQEEILSIYSGMTKNR